MDSWEFKMNFLMKWRNSFKKWLNTPPLESDMLFTNLRRTKQTLFPCKHKYERITDHSRCCKWCGDYQIKVYYQFGDKRFGWESCNFDGVDRGIHDKKNES